MNLLHLLAKRDPNLELGTGVKPTRVADAGRSYGALRLPPGEEGVVRLRTPLRWYPFNAQTDGAGWLAVARARDWNAVRANPALVELSAALLDPAGNTRAEQRSPVSFTASAVRLPRWPELATRAEGERLDLVLRNVSESGTPIDLLISEQIPPEPLYAQAKGLGVEIGPGPYPRILPEPGRQVFYVERETAEEFKRKYNFKGKFDSLDSPEAQAFWQQIIVGRANDLPFDDNSLDFIFSADVLEHLVNPIGHLDYWRTKLRKGGRVLAIVPAIHGCSDYVNRPTKLQDWVSQYKRGGFVETAAHHRSFAEARGLSPEDLFARGYSSHFSFLTPQNLAEMLDFASARFGYASYSIEHGLNSKKIHFSLRL